MLCQEFITLVDGLIEPLERFLIQLQTGDTAALLGNDEAEVLLMDSDGKKCIIIGVSLKCREDSR